MNLVEAREGLAQARASLESAAARQADARRAFEEAPVNQEFDAARLLEEHGSAVQLQRMRLEKREAALLAAERLEQEATEARRAALIVKLRGERTAFLSELGTSLGAVVTARRAFAQAVNVVVALVGDDHARVAELRRLGEREPWPDIDVVRHAIGQLIARDAPSEAAEFEMVPAPVMKLARGLAEKPTDEFEPALRRLHNEFVAVAGPTIADFCCPQILPFSDDSTASAQNARSAAALLREIEELQS